MKQQTAVEWLIQKIDVLGDAAYTPEEAVKIYGEQAKQMEKEQIVKAVTFGNRQDCYDATETLNIQYYNETYKK